MTTNPKPGTMLAWQYTTSTPLETALHLNPTAPIPTPPPSANLIRIHHASLNPVDYKPAEVPLLSRLLIRKPATPGVDFSGVIEVPAASSPFRRGDPVFGMAGVGAVFAAGTVAQFAIAGAEGTVGVPAGVGSAEAATIGVAGVTAYQSIAPFVSPGRHVFINGGSGGTGVYGIQVAKAAGCYVAATCSTGNISLCKSLGADLVIDYTTHNVVDALVSSGVKFDHVVDNVCADLALYWRCHEYTAPGAVYVKIAGTPTVRYLLDAVKMALLPAWLGGGRRRVKDFFAAAKAGDLRQLAEWMREGKVRAVIEQRYAFEQVPEAFRRLKTGRTRGKLVIEIPPADV